MNEDRLPRSMNACQSCDTAAPLPRGTIWRYEDARGITHRGIVTRTTDFGGTDVVYQMSSHCGAFVVLSGSRLRAASITR